MVKVETHLHTAESSPCGKVKAADGIAACKAAGYDAVVVTDHFCDILDDLPGSPRERADRFLDGYRYAKEAGEKLGVHVLFAVEARLPGGPEDILFYGVTPEFILENPLLYTYPLPEVYKTLHDFGAITVQAHPFRELCRPLDPRFLDGVEIFNTHPRHENHNRLALLFAEKYQIPIRTSGSDFHQMPDVGRGGMLFDTLPLTERDLRNALVAGNGRLIHP